MKLNFMKLMFIIIMMLSMLISISAKNWIGIWMGMEINLMSFIPFISKSKNKKSSKSMMIYFLTQSIGSILMLFSILMMKFLFLNHLIMEDMMNLLLLTSILIKLGAAPFHHWFPKVMMNLMWMEALILMTWQKIIPLYMLSLLPMTNTLFIPIILSSIIGAIGGMNYSSLLKIMSFSSINHLSWIMIMIKCQIQWFKYFILYSVIMFMLIILLNDFNIYFLNQVDFCSNSILEKFSISFLMLSLGGMPPFLGFLPKWMAIQSMIYYSMNFLLLILILMSVVTLFYYMRMISPLLLMSTSLNKFFYKNKQSTYLYLIMMINSLLPLFLIIF
uniref:NADH dehydrogenase subunit 2 n=1 Tax=Bochrus foveatus TaxID=2969364 RepID=UPI002176ACF4|nr:NADH dehydrogenase subunit 2 [Bochrus foveatus]UUJ37712.1 NADH dehydrogenase subunit 2 [Bochrus foveatus]